MARDLTEDAPDAILVGDSHVLALQQGADALGLRTVMLKSGGIHWNAGKIRVFAPRRGRSPLLPALGAEVTALEERLGRGDVFDGSVPVIASIGFHCGHLARAFGAQGHVAWPPPAGLDDGEPALFASAAMLEAFVTDRRAAHLALLAYIAGRGRLTAILPPRAPKNEHKTRFRHNIDALTGAISRRMRGMGIDVHDPNEDFVGPGELLPRELVKEDGFHGSPEYGRMVMERLVARGALDRADEREAETS